MRRKRHNICVNETIMDLNERAVAGVSIREKFDSNRSMSRWCCVVGGGVDVGLDVHNLTGI